MNFILNILIQQNIFYQSIWNKLLTTRFGWISEIITSP